MTTATVHQGRLPAICGSAMTYIRGNASRRYRRRCTGDCRHSTTPPRRGTARAGRRDPAVNWSRALTAGLPGAERAGLVAQRAAPAGRVNEYF